MHGPSVIQAASDARATREHRWGGAAALELARAWHVWTCAAGKYLVLRCA